MIGSLSDSRPRESSSSLSGCRSAILSLVCFLVVVLASCTSGPPEKPKVEAPKGPTPYKLVVPVGLDADAVIIPPDNPLTEEKIKLGKKLYFEKSLSMDGTIACASCHFLEGLCGSRSSFHPVLEARRATVRRQR